MTDEDTPTSTLVRRGARGDEAALTALVRRHLRAAYAVALAVLRDPSDAEDTAQEAFVVVLSRLDDCDPEKFRAWFTTVVRRRAMRVAKQRRRRERVTAEADAGVALGVGPGDHGLRRQLVDALEALTPAQREVVLLHELDEWTHAEIAEALGMSEVNCRQHLFTARRTLRARIERTLGPEEVSDVRAPR